jgi:hypothetical protein
MVSIHRDYWPCPTCHVKQTRICGGTIFPYKQKRRCGMQKRATVVQNSLTKKVECVQTVHHFTLLKHCSLLPFMADFEKC